MVKEKLQEPGQEPEFEEEEMANKSRKAKKPRAAKQKERARPVDTDPSEPSTIFYMHSLLLFGGRLLHRVLGFYNSLFELTPNDQAKIYRNISNHYARKGKTDIL